MNAQFKNLPIKNATLDGRNVVLLADVFYQAADGATYCLPAGATSDGASTPREIWPLIPPFGKYWPAAVLHDCAYRNTLLRAQPSTLNAQPDTGVFVRANLLRGQCDALLKEAMLCLGVNEVEAETIYVGVMRGGDSAFEKDRAAGWQAFMA